MINEREVKNDNVYSLNDEEWVDDWCDIMDDLIESGNTEVSVGTGVKADHADFIRPYDIVETMQELAYDQYDDYAEDYAILSDIQMQQLKLVITKWFNDNVEKPTFYKVTNVRKMDASEVIKGYKNDQ